MNNALINDITHLKEVSAGKQAWIVCFSAALFFFYEFVQINMFNAISAGLMQTFSLNATQLGNLAATYLYSTVVFLFPIGMMLDRFSTRKLILTAMSICITCTFLFAISHSLLMAQLCRLIAGAAGAFCFLSSLILASRWFPPQRMAIVTGLLVTMAMVGGVIAQTPVTLLTEAIGWRHVMVFDAGVGIIFLCLIWFNVQDYPRQHELLHKTIRNKLYTLGFFKSIYLAILNRQTWCCGLYTCLLNLLILLFGAVWGSAYLQQVHHLTAIEASYVTSMIFIGTIIGSPIFGWVSDRIRLRRLPMIVGALMSLVLILILMLTPKLSLFFLLFLFLALGFSTSTQIISYPTIIESTPKALAGAAEGVASAIIMAGGAIFQPLFGWMMDFNWHGITVNGVRVYSAQNFHLAMVIFPLAFFVSIILALSIRETHCKQGY